MYMAIRKHTEQVIDYVLVCLKIIPNIKEYDGIHNFIYQSAIDSATTLYVSTVHTYNSNDIVAKMQNSMFLYCHNFHRVEMEHV